MERNSVREVHHNTQSQFLLPDLAQRAHVSENDMRTATNNLVNTGTLPDLHIGGPKVHDDKPFLGPVEIGDGDKHPGKNPDNRCHIEPTNGAYIDDGKGNKVYIDAYKPVCTVGPSEK